MGGGGGQSNALPANANISVNQNAPGWGGSGADINMGKPTYYSGAVDNAAQSMGYANEAGNFDLGMVQDGGGFGGALSNVFSGMADGQGGGMDMGQLGGVVGLASKLLDLGGGKEKAGADMKSIGVGPMSPRISGQAFEYKSPYDPSKNPAAAQAYDSMWKNMVSQGIQNNLLKFQNGRLTYA